MGVDNNYLVEDVDSNGNKFQRMGTVAELAGRFADPLTDDDYQPFLNNILNDAVGGPDFNPSQAFAERYNNMVKNPDAE